MNCSSLVCLQSVVGSSVLEFNYWRDMGAQRDVMRIVPMRTFEAFENTNELESFDVGSNWISLVSVDNGYVITHEYNEHTFYAGDFFTSFEQANLAFAKLVNRVCKRLQANVVPNSAQAHSVPTTRK